MVHPPREHQLLSLICLGSYMAPASLAESTCLRENHFCCTEHIFGRRRGITAKNEITHIRYYSSHFFSMILRSWEEVNDFLSALTDSSAKTCNVT